MKTQNSTHCPRGRTLAALALVAMAVATVRADYQSVVLNDHPLAYYPLNLNVDTGTTATDLSGNGFTGSYFNIGSAYNSVPGPTPYITNAVSFDGYSAWVDLPVTESLNFSGAITMEAWVKPVSANTFGDIIAKGWNNNGAEVMLRANGVYGGFYGGGSGGVGGGVQTANWTHVVCANDGTTWRMYVDGALVGQGSGSGAVSFAEQWRIGTGSANGYARFFEGNITQVALYNYGLTAEQVQAHYFTGKYGSVNPPPSITSQPVSRTVYAKGTARFSVSADSAQAISYQWYKGSTALLDQTNTTLVIPNVQAANAGSYSVTVGNSSGTNTSSSVTLTVLSPTGYDSVVMADLPLAYYPLNESSGNDALDYAGTFNGAFKNSPSLGASGPSAFISSGVRFNVDSSSQKVDLGNPEELNFSGPITLEAWVQPSLDSITAGLGNIVAKGYDSQYNNEIILRADGQNGARYTAGSGSAYLSGGTQTTDWAHVVLSNDGTNSSLYVNGVMVSQTGDTTGAKTFGSPWQIATGSGDYGGGRYFRGVISQVALYNHGLTSAQVLSHYFFGQYGSTVSNTAPVITAQPASQVCNPGGTATFNVQVLSGLPVTYQWYRSGILLADKTNATLVLANVLPANAGNYTVTVTSSAGSTPSAAATLSVTEGASLKWAANNNSGVWDTGTSANWINMANSQQVVFNAADKVLFDDTPGVPTTVALDSVVNPGTVTIDSSANNFTISGSGSISDGASLVKKGTSTLTLSAVNNFTGPLTIQAGTVVPTVDGALGSSLGAVIITNQGVLDLNGRNFSSKPLIISGMGTGNGALVNGGGEIYGLNADITLTGDTAFSGNRFDLNNSSSLKSDGQARSLNIIGGYREWTNPKIDANVGNIELNGKLGLKNMTSLGDPNGVLTVQPGWEVDYWSGNGPAKVIHVMPTGKAQVFTGGVFSNSFIFEANAQLNAFWMGNNPTVTFSGPVTLNGTPVFTLGDAQYIFSNVISGPGGIFWENYNVSMTFSAANTYQGITFLGNGRTLKLAGNGSISASSPIVFGGTDGSSIKIDASGRPDQTLTLTSGQMLFGAGKVSGSLIAQSGATIQPGTNGVLGVLGASSAVELHGVTVMKLNGSGTNDQIQAGTTLTYGGTLSLTDLSGSLVAGDSFQLFTATTYAGSFASITPASPGAGLVWDTTQLSSGKLSVAVAQAAKPSVTQSEVVGGNLIFSGANGIAGGEYYVLVSANVATPVANWTVLSTNLFDSNGGFTVTNAINPNAPQQFYMLKLK